MNTNQLNEITRCPHCNIAAPFMRKVWGENTKPNDGTKARFWAAYVCNSCGGTITAKGHGPNPDTHVSSVYPEIFEPDKSMPQRAGRYLGQAYLTLAQPDASVVMSGSAIDAMLKEQGLEDGSLYQRIDQAVEQGIMTRVMSEWAHRVRLDANNPRHADADHPHMDAEDALRAFGFAKALGDFLYVLPSTMPEKPETTEG